MLSRDMVWYSAFEESHPYRIRQKGWNCGGSRNTFVSCLDHGGDWLYSTTHFCKKYLRKWGLDFLLFNLNGYSTSFGSFVFTQNIQLHQLINAILPQWHFKKGSRWRLVIIFKIFFVRENIHIYCVWGWQIERYLTMKYL